ncbi:MAG: hypothetical protein AB7N24_23450 [Dehalococcoidia bacterium]
MNDEPYLLWEWELKKRNLEFLNGIDSEHFNFLLDLFASAQDTKRASVGARTTLHHSLETLFSLLGAMLQSPSCVYGWLSRCSTPLLRDVVRRIDRKDEGLFRVWRISAPSWHELASLVFRHYASGTEKQATTTKQFGELWARLAHDFANEDHIDEYNSIKHGFRVKRGGFTLRVGPEREKGLPASQADLTTIGSSEYGCSFFRISRLGSDGSRNLRSSRVSLNWHIEKDLLLIQLVAMSIHNVVSALQIINGIPAETVRFVRPEDDEAFERPWRLASGVFQATIDFKINEELIPHTTRHDLVTRMIETMTRMTESK